MPEIIAEIERIIPEKEKWTPKPRKPRKPALPAFGIDWNAIEVGGGFFVEREKHGAARVAASRYGRKQKRRYRVMKRGDKVYVVRKK